MRASSQRLLGLFSLAGLLAGASPAAAADDPAAAEALFNRGVTAMDAGQYEAACKGIAESQRLDPRPGTLFTLATCESKWGHVATAATRFGDYLALYDQLPKEQQARQGGRPKVAKEEREKLIAEIPELTLVLPQGAPAGTVVKRDGAVMADAALGLGLPVDPGEYVISTQAPGGAVWEQRVTLGKGEKKQLPLEVKAAPKGEGELVAAFALRDPWKESIPEPKADTNLVEGTSGRRKAAYVTGAVGVAGFVIGGITSGLLVARDGRIQAACAAHRCSQGGITEIEGGKPILIANAVAFGVGIAGVGLGAYLLISEGRSGASKAALSPLVLPDGGGASLVGRF